MPHAHSQPSNAIELRVVSNPARVAEVRKTLEGFCRGHGWAERSVGEVGLCVNEALANVIRHAYLDRHDLPIELSAEMREQTLFIRIRDWGLGLLPPPPDASRYDPLKPGGIGMICLARLMERVEFEPQDDGMMLILQRREHKPSASADGH